MNYDMKWEQEQMLRVFLNLADGFKEFADEVDRLEGQAEGFRKEIERLREKLGRWCDVCGFEFRERGACQCPDDGEL